MYNFNFHISIVIGVISTTAKDIAIHHMYKCPNIRGRTKQLHYKHLSKD